MKFVIKLSVVVLFGVFVIGVYHISTTQALTTKEIPASLYMAQQRTFEGGAQQVATTIAQPDEASVANSQQGIMRGRQDFVVQSPEVVHQAVQMAPTPGTPVHVSIPAAGIEAPVINVGLNSKGEMDVPDGATNNVGWYSPGTKPGAVGSAVLDAHVYAALKTLHKTKVGDDIYIDTAGGRLHFVVEEVTYYALSDVPREKLFNRADQPRLNLITCAGTFVPSMGTYDHRLVVYATLLE